MYVRCDESSLYSRINYVHSPDGELLCGRSGIIKTMCTQGLARTRITLCQCPGVDTEETGRYDLAQDLCSVLNAFSNRIIIKGIVISFMFMDICNPSENSCFSKIFPVLLKCDFS